MYNVICVYRVNCPGERDELRKHHGIVARCMLRKAYNKEKNKNKFPKQRRDPAESDEQELTSLAEPLLFSPKSQNAGAMLSKST